MMELLAAGVGLLLILALAIVALLLRRSDGGLLASQREEGDLTRDALAVVQRELAVAQRAEVETLRTVLGRTERMLLEKAEQGRFEAQATLAGLHNQLVRDQGEQRVLLETKLREMSDQAALRLADIQRSVNERLTESIEKTVQGSFQRVVDQFAQVQKAMGDVQAVTAQIGDLKRIFTNVKTRGAWGEMHLRALLEDVLPHGAWEANRKLRDDSDDIVEFVLLMPSRARPQPVLAIDAKFPAEDYDRLLLAAEAGDAAGERAARRGLETRIRLEARKIGSKYIVPPTTVDFALMYLPTDGLYVEAARMPGLIESLNKDYRVLIMGPSLLPALLRTLQLGALTLTIEQRAEEIQRLLGAVRTEFGKMDGVLAKLEKQAGSVSTTILDARRRTRAMDRTLRNVAVLKPGESGALLQLDDENAEGPGITPEAFP
ncbi:MAG: DNA recombination protein RmuC [Janthinobacterium lividum]